MYCNYTYMLVNVLSIKATMSGRFSFSLYVGKIILYFMIYTKKDSLFNQVNRF